MNEFRGLNVPPAFVAQVGVVADELLYGYRNSWLDDENVIEVALSQYREGILVDDRMERLALLLNAERREVDFIAPVNFEGEDNSALERVWIYIFAKWLYETDDTPRSFRTIEEIYADFGYPESLRGFVGYMPVDEGAPVGPLAMNERWKDYLSVESEYFRNRVLTSR